MERKLEALQLWFLWWFLFIPWLLFLLVYRCNIYIYIYIYLCLNLHLFFNFPFLARDFVLSHSLSSLWVVGRQIDYIWCVFVFLIFFSFFRIETIILSFSMCVFSFSVLCLYNLVPFYSLKYFFLFFSLRFFLQLDFSGTWSCCATFSVLILILQLWRYINKLSYLILSYL